MAIKIVSLTHCPFCGDVEGDIFLDAHATYDLLASCTDCEKACHDKVIMHNSPLPDDEPCPHILWLYVDVARGRLRNDAFHYGSEDVDFTWEHPLLRDLDTCGPVLQLLYRFAYDLEHEQFLPQGQHEFDSFEFRWRREGDPPQDIFRAYGRAAFAQDVPRFIDELAVQADRLEAAWADGRDTAREWREIRAKRKRALDYDYEYEEC